VLEKHPDFADVACATYQSVFTGDVRTMMDADRDEDVAKSEVIYRKREKDMLFNSAGN
jgi:hypothetical protein